MRMNLFSSQTYLRMQEYFDSVRVIEKKKKKKEYFIKAIYYSTITL